jgi:hypothetical protein
VLYKVLGHAVAQLVQAHRYKGSISKEVIGIFQWLNPSGSTMAQELTQPLKEMSTKGISLGKGVRAMG